MSYLRQIRKHCLMCMGGSYKAVEFCDSPACLLWWFRSGKASPAAPITPAEAIEAFCLTCVGSVLEVGLCDDQDCPFWGCRARNGSETGCERLRNTAPEARRGSRIDDRA